MKHLISAVNRIAPLEPMPLAHPPSQYFGNLEARLAIDESEIRASQKLRYRIFYDDMGAIPTPDFLAQKREFDKYDDICDHLLIFDHNLGRGADAVVGTYRLIRQNPSESVGGFYSTSEYDIGKILNFPGNLLELGRSCVHEKYRTRPTLQLLWRGIAAYVFHHKIDLLFGCASFPGGNINQHAEAVSYLYHYHLAPEHLRVRTLPHLYADMNLMPKSAIDPRRALSALPPLIKGYMRLGGFFGDGAFIDRQFNSIDVFVIVQTDLITDKYFKYYERTAIMDDKGDSA